MHAVSETDRRRPAWLSAALALSAVAVLVCLPGCGKGKAVAVVNGTKIEKEEFYHQLERSHGVNVLSWCILRQLLLDECAAQGLTIAEAELNAAVAQWKQAQGFVGEERFALWLRAMNMDESDLREDLRLEMMKEKLRTKGVAVTDEEVQAEYEHRKVQGEMTRPATVTLGEVVCESEEKAREAEKRLREGANMSDVVKEFMINDPTWAELRSRNGVWPARRKEDIYPTELQELAFELPVGDTGEPIKSVMGFYHVVRVIERTAEKPFPFEEVKEPLKREMRLARGIPEDQLLQQLAHKAKVKIEWPAYLPMQDRFGQAPVVPGTLPPGVGQAGESGAAGPAPGLLTSPDAENVAPSEVTDPAEAKSGE